MSDPYKYIISVLVLMRDSGLHHEMLSVWAYASMATADVKVLLLEPLYCERSVGGVLLFTYCSVFNEPDSSNVIFNNVAICLVIEHCIKRESRQMFFNRAHHRVDLDMSTMTHPVLKSMFLSSSSDSWVQTHVHFWYS